VVHYVGIDLAWGERSPTGVAVVDGSGRLVELAAVRTDDEVAAVLAAYDGPCVAAIDAPLVVANPTGKRGAERALDRDFARFQAATHASNTTRPWFVPEPRGARLAARLDLSLDDPTARRRAIEVYPHAATVALFGLPRTLKYKNKPGRTLDSLRSELLQLVRLLGTLHRADPPLDVTGAAWEGIVSAIGSATRKADLRRAEDPVDAVVCAYVAAYAATRPGDVTTYADETGAAIVTPSLRRPAP
jgi:predicted RNase H-like nuclease